MALDVVESGQLEVIPGVTKRCSKCGEVKEVGEFYRIPARSDGLDYECKECRRKQSSRMFSGRNSMTKKEIKSFKRVRYFDGNELKQCKKCKQWLPETDYYKDSREPDGLKIQCKWCRDIAHADYTEKHRKELVFYNKIYRLSHPEWHKEQMTKAAIKNFFGIDAVNAGHIPIDMIELKREHLMLVRSIREEYK